MVSLTARSYAQGRSVGLPLLPFLRQEDKTLRFHTLEEFLGSQHPSSRVSSRQGRDIGEEENGVLLELNPTTAF